MSQQNVITLAPAKAVTTVHARVIKADKSNVAGGEVRGRSYEFEDEFAGKYSPGAVADGLEVLEPPFAPRALESLCQQNNTLPVCVDAMVTNVHGTGYDIVPTEEGDKDTDEHKALQAFFEETFPNESLDQLRKQLGRDYEKTGNGYLEVLRNLEGKIVFLRRLDPKLTRLLRLDEPRQVTVKIRRGGEDVEALVWMRYRRFVQMIHGNSMQYYRPFGCPLKLSATKGGWIKDGDEVAIDDAASEVIHFSKDPDSLTPYGVPSWIAQMPSVLGSRKAEEHNLDFFDAGGVPPMMVFVHGGQLTADAADALRNHLQGGARNKHTIPVIEAISTSGSIDGANNVKVTVERFGSERQNDSMFEAYDDKCEKRVRRSWRLPPLFVGAAEDFSFATAYASYTVAEAQVFAPERAEFDEIINRTIMRELDPDQKFKFRSRPITVRDIENQLKALELAAKGKSLSRQQFLDVINEITNLSLRKEDEDLVDLNPTPAGGPLGDPMAGLPDAAVDPETGLPIEDPAAAGGDPAATEATITDDGSGGTPDAVGLTATKADFIGMDPESLAHTAFDLFRYGAQVADVDRLMSAVQGLGAGTPVFKSELARCVLLMDKDEELQDGFADSVFGTVISWLRRAA